MNDINIVLSNDKLKNALPNEDHVSGIIFLRSYATGGTAPATPFVKSKVLDLADAITQGITELAYPEEYYQIKRFFEKQANSYLYIMFGAAEEAAFDFSEITDLQNYADGKLRQVLIMTFSAFDDTNITLIQAECDSLFELHKPVFCLYAADLTAMTLSSFTDARLNESYDVSVIIGMDGAGSGKTLFDAGKIVTAGGLGLAAVSLAAVSESIAWVQKFNMTSSDNEFDEPAFANGDLVKETGDTLLTQLENFGYIFLRKHVGISGSYWNDNSTCDLITSSYAYMNARRTAHKASRNIRTYVLPKLSSPLTFESTGKLSQATIVDLKNTASRALEEMYRNAEISSFTVDIDPNQDALASSLVIINVTIVMNGVARNFSIKLNL